MDFMILIIQLKVMMKKKNHGLLMKNNNYFNYYVIMVYQLELMEDKIGKKLKINYQIDLENLIKI